MTQYKKTPPRYGTWILKYIIDSVEHDSLFGDIDELYEIKVHEQGYRQARRWYSIQMGKALVSGCIHRILWRFYMLRHYLKTALRTVKRQKGYSVINIVGLAVGLACTTFIFMWIQDELSYDRFHPDSDRIFRVVQSVDNPEGDSHLAKTAFMLSGMLKVNLPEIQAATRYRVLNGWLVKRGDIAFYGERVANADPEFFELFPFPFLKGDPMHALIDPTSVVLTESMAKKYFADVEPMGQMIRLQGSDYRVTGVMADLPSNSQLQFDFIISLENFYWLEYDGYKERIGCFTYLLLNRSSVGEIVGAKATEILKEQVPETKASLLLQPLERVHLYSNLEFDLATQGEISYVTIFASAALLILLVACLNFMNLSTARFAKRSLEVGMRKVVGARRKDLIKQFYCESFFFLLISCLVSALFVSIFLPAFNTLSGKSFSVDQSFTAPVLVGILFIILVTGLISGSYPALVLSAFRPVNVLKGIYREGSKGARFRKVLVVAQFTMAIVLIIGTTVIHRQLRYIHDRRLGFDAEQLVYMRLDHSLEATYSNLKTALLKDPRIKGVTKTLELPVALYEPGTTDVEWEGMDPNREVLIHDYPVGFDFFEVFGVNLIEGRYFSESFGMDEEQSFILNESAVRTMGLEKPLGRRIRVGGTEGMVVGVVEDFHYSSLHHAIEPLAMRGYGHAHIVVARMDTRSTNISDILGFIEREWKAFTPGFPFIYHFVDETIDGLYRSEERLATLFNRFTILAVFISCLGLLGLASFMTERRTKEIGIRKVLGASTLSVLLLLSTEFSRSVLIANLIAWPVAYVAMRRWLGGFAYRSTLGLSVFLFAGALALTVALITVSTQSIRSTLSDPVDSLRDE